MNAQFTSFDEMIDRRGTGCNKWDDMPARYGIPAETGLAMWVADMDFRPPQCVADALAETLRHGVFGYHGDETPYLDAIRWWMAERHGWEVPRGDIFSVHGLVNGTALCLDAFTQPGDGIVLFTPVYHAFARVIRAAERQVVELPLPIVDGRYTFDFDALDARMTGKERMLILCSPHNPGGRVWSREELEGVAVFARRHDLILISDEAHHDLVMPGHTHIPMARIEGIADRLVMMTAATKAFNLAGAHIGNVIISDERLRARFARRAKALSISAGLFGVRLVEAAYSPEGAQWIDALTRYLDGNRRLFDDAMAGLPGVTSMPLEATYLAWVDFAATGMSEEEVRARVCDTAHIAPNIGATFGTGGETFLRFNLGTQRARVAEAAERLKAAFSDLQ